MYAVAHEQALVIGLEMNIAGMALQRMAQECIEQVGRIGALERLTVRIAQMLLVAYEPARHGLPGGKPGQYPVARAQKVEYAEILQIEQSNLERMARPECV